MTMKTHKLVLDFPRFDTHANSDIISNDRLFYFIIDKPFNVSYFGEDFQGSTGNLDLKTMHDRIQSSFFTLHFNADDSKVKNYNLSEEDIVNLLDNVLDHDPIKDVRNDGKDVEVFLC